MKRFSLRQSILQLTPSQVTWVLLILIMLTYTIAMGHETILRYDTFRATAFDLGNMDQVIWNTIHGRPFQFTNQGADWYGPPTRLAIHFEPILFPISLLYLFHSDPRIIIIFQTLALVSGALPVFLLTRHSLPNWPFCAPVMALAYLLCPSQLGLNVFDFHPVSLATPFLLYAMLALTYRRYGWFLLACVLAASCKEDIPLSVAMLGILVVWKYKLPRLGTLLIVGGMLWSMLAFMVIIPHFYPGAQHNNYWYRYEELGSSPGAAVVNLLLHPWLLLTTFITLDRFYYLAGLFRSFGFFSLLAPEWLLPALPSLAVNLLSNDTLLYSGVYHYNAAIIPFLILTAIHGIRRAQLLWMEWREESTEAFKKHTPLFVVSTRSGQSIWANSFFSPARSMITMGIDAIFVGIQSIVTFLTVAYSSVAYAGFTRTFIRPRLVSLVNMGNHQWQRLSGCMAPVACQVAPIRLQKYICTWILAMLALNVCIGAPLLNIFWATHEPGSREQHIQQLLDMIPPDASVSASVSLNPHLTERLYVTVFPEITFSTSEKNIKNIVQYVIVDLYEVFPEDQVNTANALNQLITSKQFRMLARAEGVILLVRRTP